jgi:hypothetical protein
MFRELAQRAKRINVEQLALGVAISNSGLIADNIRDQLSVGKSGDNAAVGIYSSLPYARLKSRTSKAPFGVVNLKLSGDLYDKIFVKITPTKVETGSNVSYSKYQIDRYGKRIYENTPENSGKVKDKNSRDIARAYSKLLGL